MDMVSEGGSDVLLSAHDNKTYLATALPKRAIDTLTATPPRYTNELRAAVYSIHLDQKHRNWSVGLLATGSESSVSLHFMNACYLIL